MRKGEIVTGSLSGLSFLAAFDAYAGTGTSSWLADLCLSSGASAPMIEGMPMEDHSSHAAYFTSAGLTFLAAALGWEYAETQAAKLTRSEPQGTARKRLLATIVYVVTAANCANRKVIDQAFHSATGYALGPTEAKEAYAFLMKEDAPDLHRILAGASRQEQKSLLHSLVLTWAAHGMDSEQSTKVTEHIVTLLGFDQDDICKTLDRLWLKDKGNKGFRAACRLAGKGAQSGYRLLRRATLATGHFLAPYARQLGTRVLTTIQR